MIISAFTLTTATARPASDTSARVPVDLVSTDAIVLTRGAAAFIDVCKATFYSSKKYIDPEN